MKNKKMKMGTKVLIGVGTVGAAFAICYKWGPCRSFFVNAVPSAEPPTVTPADSVGTSGPMMPSPTDFAAQPFRPVGPPRRKVTPSGNGTLVVSLSDPTYKVKYDESEWKNSPAKGKLADYLGEIDDVISSKKAEKFLDAYGGALGHRPKIEIYYKTGSGPGDQSKVAEYIPSTSEYLSGDFKKSFSLPPGRYFASIPGGPREETSKREFPTGMYYFRSDGPHGFTRGQMEEYWEAGKIWYSHTRTRMYVEEGSGKSAIVTISAGKGTAVSVRRRFVVGMKDKHYFKDPGSVMLGTYGKAWNYSHN